MKLTFERYFTTPGDDVYKTVAWRKTDAVLKEPDGTVVFQQNDVEIPVFWSDRAAQIVASKYFRMMNGARETSVKQMISRVVGTICQAAGDQGLLGHGSTEAIAFHDELTYMLLHQMFSFNSPVWFNVGVKENPQGSACFILGVADNMESIINLQKNEVQIFKGGSGAGSNLSAIRSSREKLSGGGWASGPVSFAKGYDAWAGVTKSGGTTRRAAKLLALNVDHPDILEQRDGTPGFIRAKAAAEKLAHDLYGTGKYTAEFNVPGNVYDLVNFQNANLSVRVTDTFMDAVANDKEWKTKPVNSGEGTTYKAKQIWEEVAKAAWFCGDPGLQFDDTINKWHTCPNSGRINASNPCQPSFATVLTPQGIRTFADIDVGSTIWTGKQWSKVMRKVATGVKQVNRYVTTAGCFLGTQEHRVFENGERVEVQYADGIDVSDGPEMPVQPLDPQDVIDGWVFGDGAYHKASKRVFLDVGAKDEDIYTSEVAAFVTRETSGAGRYAHRVIITLAEDEVPKTWLRTVPPRFIQGDAKKVRGFLRGLYSANGSVCGGRITLKATSLQAIRDVQVMLSSLGIRSYYTTNKPAVVEFENGEYLCKQSYDLNITHGRQSFMTNIGFVQQYKQEKLREACNLRQRNYRKTTYDIVNVEELGEFPVWDIEVEAEEHAYWTGGLLVSNCSEFMFLDNSACNLGSLNLCAFWNPETGFDVQAFGHACRTAIFAMETLVDLSSYPTAEITANSRKFRPLGLGYTNLGALLMSMGFPYDSDIARNHTTAITAMMTGYAYAASAELAAVKGPFEGFKENREEMLTVVDMHHDQAVAQYKTSVSPLMLYAIKALEVAVRHGKRYGYRNAQATLLAPTGTIAFMMDCDTTSGEPAVALVTYKKLVGGGTLKMPLLCVEDALKSLGYSADERKQITEHIANTDGLLPELLKSGHVKVFETALGNHQVSLEGHLQMMAAQQPFLSGAISKTVNLPETATVEDFSRAYMQAWQLGLKAVALYRNNCKLSQPANAKASKKEAAAASAQGSLQWGKRKRLPDTRKSITHKFTVGGQEGYLFVGLNPEGQPAEIFIEISKEGSTLSGLLNMACISMSIALQHGAPLKTLVEKFKDTKFEPHGFTSNADIRRVSSLADYIARWLAQTFLGEGEACEPAAESLVKAVETSNYSGPPCSNCGNLTVRQSSCWLCPTCGTTTGCS